MPLALCALFLTGLDWKCVQLAQTSDVIGYTLDLTVVESRSHPSHRQAVEADAVAESGQLRRDVLGVLACQPRILNRNSRGMC